MKKETNTYSSLGIPVSFVYNPDECSMTATDAEPERVSTRLTRLQIEIQRVNESLKSIAVIMSIGIVVYTLFQIFQ